MTLRHSKWSVMPQSRCFGQREETSGYDVPVNVAYTRVRSLNEVRSVVRMVLPW
jgi:hypothetical protein